MTIEEKRQALEAYCESRDICNGCVFHTVVGCVYDDRRVDESYNLVFGGEQNVQRNEHFAPLKSGTTQEEINHPDRYAGGKFECIDVMLDVFGADAVKHFCILNAFKYIWRAEKKNGVEDIKKAVWYLNKYIELGGEE